MSKRQMWQLPWRYKESFTIVLGVVVIGVVLQCLLGSINYTLFSYPVNIIIGSALLLILIGLFFIRKSAFYQWLSGVPLAVTLLVTILFLTLIMGLTPQYQSIVEHENKLLLQLGVYQMTSAWYFSLTYLFLILALGSLILRRLALFRKSDLAFYSLHIGLWILLFVAGLGAADIKRYTMYVNENEVEWRGYDLNNELVELPIAIQLNKFTLEEYPPKLVIINKLTGELQPEGRPDVFQIDKNRKKGRLWNYDIEVKDYIHNAMRNSDSTYREINMPGSCPAALVQAISPDGVKESWVCAGNRAQLFMVLPLDSLYTLVMTEAEPRRFISDITTYAKDEGEKHTLLEVNKPLRMGSWTIYQYGYDNIAGRMSSFSSFELVYDPWLPGVYIGIFILSIGCVILLWRGSQKRGAKI